MFVGQPVSVHNHNSDEMLAVVTTVLNNKLDYTGPDVYGRGTTAGQRAAGSTGRAWRAAATAGTPTAQRAPAGHAAGSACPPGAAPRHDAWPGPAAARRLARLRRRRNHRVPVGRAGFGPAAGRATPPACCADASARSAAAEHFLGQRRTPCFVTYAGFAAGARP